MDGSCNLAKTTSNLSWIFVGIIVKFELTSLFVWLRQVTGMQQVDVFRNICCLFSSSCVPSDLRYRMSRTLTVSMWLFSIRRGRVDVREQLPHVQCGSRRKLTVSVQTMMCSHVFLTTTPWLELGRSLNITIHSRDTWAEPTLMVVVWVIKRLVLRIVSQYGSPSLPTNGMGSGF